MRSRRTYSVFREVRHRLWVILGAGALTLAFFIVLPLMQTISDRNPDDLIVREVDLAVPPPPAPPVEQEPEPEPEPEDTPPQLAEAPAPLDLDMLSLAMEPTLGDGWMGSADISVNLSRVVAAEGGGDADAVFSAFDLDQKPRAVYQPSPLITGEMRRKAPGTVYILFTVDERGRVVEPRVQQSTDPVFEKSALSAVKQWQFEPGKRGGKSVRFRMRVPITFPEG